MESRPSRPRLVGELGDLADRRERLRAGATGSAACPEHPRLRDPGRAGPGRHGRGLPGLADRAEAPGGAEDGARGRPWPARRCWRGSASRPRPWPGCSTPTSSRSTRSASTTGCRFLVLELVEGRSLAQRLAGTPQPAEWAAGADRDAGAGHPRGAPAGGRPPRPEAGQRPAGRRRHAQDHRLRPGQAAHRRRRAADPDRRAAGHAQLHGARAGRPAGTRRSARRPTSTRWGRSSTSC